MTTHEAELAQCSLHSFKTMLSKRDDWSDLAERAAIMEYDGGLSRAQAEVRVMEELWKNL